MIELIKVLNARWLGGFRVAVEFSNGSSGIRDFADMVGEGGRMIEPLKDPAFFGRLFVQSGVLAWPNGFDIDAIALHEEMRTAGLLEEAVLIGD